MYANPAPSLQVQRMLLWDQQLPYDLEGWARMKHPKFFQNLSREMKLQSAIQDLYHVTAHDRGSWIQAEGCIFTTLGLSKEMQAECMIESVVIPPMHVNPVIPPIGCYLGTRVFAQGEKRAHKRKSNQAANVAPIEAPMPKLVRPALPEPAVVNPAAVLHDQIRDLKKTIMQATKRSTKLKEKLQEQLMRLKQSQSKHDRLKSSLHPWSPQSQRDEVTSLSIAMDQHQETAGALQDKVDEIMKRLLGMTTRLEVLKGRQAHIARKNQN